jgi:alkanesulfonate monooxygenase SsuD/methylene tetrahydromethanopterin reductase-like flavin-dependent oxidoreductase (luciferase family)
VALRERIEAITEIWTREQASYIGATLRFDPLQSWPKPYQRPRPVVLLGGNGPRAPERAMAWADGWLPHTEPGGDEPLLARLAQVRRRAPHGFQLTLAMAPSSPTRLRSFVAAGVDRFLFQLPTGTRELAEARVERAMAALASLS